MSKAVLKEKERQLQLLARKYCQNGPAKNAWDTNENLKLAWQHFLDILPKDATRTNCMQNFAEFVRKKPNQPDEWISFLNSPPFLKNLISIMKERADRNDRIQLQFERYPELKETKEKVKEKEPVLSSAAQGTTTTTITAAVPIAAAVINEKLSLQDEKERRIEEENEKVDMIWEGVVSPEDLNLLSFICVKCGRKGTLSESWKQTRKGDEGSTLFEKCRLCKRREKT